MRLVLPENLCLLKTKQKDYCPYMHRYYRYNPYSERLEIFSSTLSKQYSKKSDEYRQIKQK